jgi:hypothetical protein
MLRMRMRMRMKVPAAVGEVVGTGVITDYRRITGVLRGSLRG